MFLHLTFKSDKSKNVLTECLRRIFERFSVDPRRVFNLHSPVVFWTRSIESVA